MLNKHGNEIPDRPTLQTVALVAHDAADVLWSQTWEPRSKPVDDLVQRSSSPSALMMSSSVASEPALTTER